jgi:hypothetical protein
MLRVSAQTLARDCAVGAVAVIRPGRLPLVLGPLAGASTAIGAANALAFPADGSIVSARGISVAARRCGAQTGQLSSLSLFGGAVTATRVSLDGARAAVVGLAVGGKRTPSATGARVPLARWGYLVVRPPAPVHVSGGALLLSGLAVHLTAPHGGLPAGTVLLVTAAGERPAPKLAAKHAKHAKRRRRKHVRATHEPLKVTPPLALKHYVFPVVGPSEYVDTYGAFRSDVPGNWHHGDDIFAPLGTPVVAVASGTINRVGWNAVGGWRVWVRDGAGDEFYYAHLSGYAPHDLRSNRVEAGQVIGFIGNTGDAFTTSPHVHFEIHPRQLLHLGYDGAVDPTSYLDHWRHIAHVRAPIPVHPPLPRQPAIRKEAIYVFRELLAARHIVLHPPKPSTRPHVHIPPGANGFPPPHVAAAPTLPPRAGGGLSSTEIALLAALGSLLLFGGTLLLPHVRGRLLRRRRIQPAVLDPRPPDDER